MRIKSKVIKASSFAFPCVNVMRQHIGVDEDNLRIVWGVDEDKDGKFVKFYFDEESEKNKKNIVKNKEEQKNNNDLFY